MAPNKFVLYLLIGFIVLSLIIIIMLANQNKYLSQVINHQKPLKVGQNAYLFAEKTMSGKVLNVKGKKTLIFFFSRNCPGCLKFLTQFQILTNDTKLQQIQIVGISSDPEKEIRNYLTKNNLKFDVIIDPHRKIFWKYHINFVPSIVLIDEIGQIAYFQTMEEKPIEVIKKIFGI